MSGNSMNLSQTFRCIGKHFVHYVCRETEWNGDLLRNHPVFRKRKLGTDNHRNSVPLSLLSFDHPHYHHQPINVHF
jgi:hypothetical protein